MQDFGQQHAISLHFLKSPTMQQGLYSAPGLYIGPCMFNIPVWTVPTETSQTSSLLIPLTSVFLCFVWGVCLLVCLFVQVESRCVGLVWVGLGFETGFHCTVPTGLDFAM